jgi:hypothetical protein
VHLVVIDYFGKYTAHILKSLITDSKESVGYEDKFESSHSLLTEACLCSFTCTYEYKKIRLNFLQFQTRFNAFLLFSIQSTWRILQTYIPNIFRFTCCMPSVRVLLRLKYFSLSSTLRYIVFNV